MKTIKSQDYSELPISEQASYTGIVESILWTVYLENGQRHRLDGPALVYTGGDKSYFINGKYFSKKDYYKHPEVIRNSKEFKDLLTWKSKDE